MFCQIILVQMQKEPLQLDYKLAPLYTQKLNELAADSKVSFDNFSTPGWSSIMHTETSPDHSKNKSHLNQQQILQKLNSIAKSQLPPNGRSRLRLPENTNSNILIYQQQKHLIKTSNSRSSNNSPQRDSPGSHSQPHPRQSAPTEPTPTRQSLKKTQNSRASNPAPTQREKTDTLNTQARQSTKRFGHITVHEHLYLDGIKQSNKRIMEKILDEQYKKENVMSFRPQINQKSQHLAEVRFSRVQKDIEVEEQLSEVYKKSNVTASQSYKQSRIEEKQQNKSKVLNKIFNFLSKGETLISKQTIKDVVEELPLMCIRTLEKILEKVYAGSTFTWLQFLGEINNRKVVANKQGLINIFEKWQTRMEKQTERKEPQQRNKAVRRA